MAQIFKHQNPNGTFTYTKESGEVLLKASKRDYEYYSFVMYKGHTFGTYTTCKSAWKFAEKASVNDIKYCEEVIAYKNGTGKKPHPYYQSMEKESIEYYQSHVSAIKNMLNEQAIIKIESI